MSMQDFHSQLTRTHEHDSLMATLCQLSMVEDASALIDDGTDSGWGVWTGGSTPQ